MVREAGQSGIGADPSLDNSRDTALGSTFALLLGSGDGTDRR